MKQEDQPAREGIPALRGGEDVKGEGGTSSPPGASGLSSEEVAEGLDALRLAWGGGYLFGYDPEHGWWAIEPGRLGSLLTAGSAKELGSQLAEREAAGT